MTDDLAPPAGHNNPPPDLFTGDALLEKLAADHIELSGRHADLLAAVGRAPNEITDDDTAAKMAAFLKQIVEFNKTVKAKHDDFKAPYLASSRIIDNWFKNLTDSLGKSFTAMNQLQTRYLTAKADRQRREAEERERKAREEQEAQRRAAEKAEADKRRAEREAKKAADDEAFAAAKAKAEEADRKANEARAAQSAAAATVAGETKTATASNAELSRVRGDMAMATLKTAWKYRVVDITKVPAEYLMVNDKMIRAAITGKHGKREIAGLEIYDEQTAVTR